MGRLEPKELQLIADTQARDERIRGNESREVARYGLTVYLMKGGHLGNPGRRKIGDREAGW